MGEFWRCANVRQKDLEELASGLQAFWEVAYWFFSVENSLFESLFWWACVARLASYWDPWNSIREEFTRIAAGKMNSSFFVLARNCWHQI